MTKLIVCINFKYFNSFEIYSMMLDESRSAGGVKKKKPTKGRFVHLLASTAGSSGLSANNNDTRAPSNLEVKCRP